MIKIARDAGSACKFPGSGGAIVGMCDQVCFEQPAVACIHCLTCDVVWLQSKLEVVRNEFESKGFVFVQLQPFAPTQV